MSNFTRILVIGATGAQGGSVARHLLRTGKCKVRCLTRRPLSDAAVEIERLGGELVTGDLADPATLRRALRECEGVFGVTNYWEHYERELEHGRNLVDAISGSEVRHTVLSTLPHTQLLSGGRLKVSYFDTKARIEEHARASALPATYIHVAFYYENFLEHLRPRRRGDGSYAFGFPQGTVPLAAVAADDIGGVVAALFEESFWYRDKVIGVVGDHLRCDEYAEIMHRVLQKNFAYDYVPHDAFAALPLPGAGDIADMFEFNRLYVPNRRMDVTKSRELFPEILTFERWLKRHVAAFESALAD